MKAMALKPKAAS